jgi:hypothetical protein
MHDIQNIRMRSSETFIEFFNRFEDALRNHVMLHGRVRVETDSGPKFIYPPRAFVEDNYYVEDKNRDCMRIYGQAILTDSSKESYLLNAVTGITEYKFALATNSSNGYKALRELLVKTDFDEGRNQKLKTSTPKYQPQSKPSIQYREHKVDSISIQFKTSWFRTQGRNPIPRVHYGAISRGIRAYVIRIRHLIVRIRHSNATISIWTRSALTSKVIPRDF